MIDYVYLYAVVLANVLFAFDCAYHSCMYVYIHILWYIGVCVCVRVFLCIEIVPDGAQG